MNPYLAYARIALREDIRYWRDVFASGIATIGFVAVTLLFWYATELTLFFGVYTWPMLVWYIITSQAIGGGSGDIVRVVNEHVRTGTVVTALARPVAYPLTLIADTLGGWVMRMLATVVCTVPIGLLLVGASALSIAGVVFGLISIALGVVLQCTVSMCIGLLAFWTEDARPYSWVYSKLMLVVGGVLFPLDLLPIWLRTIANFLPPAYIVYYPARLVVDFSWPLLGRVLLMQLGMLAVFGSIAAIIYRLVRARVMSNGG